MEETSWHSQVRFVTNPLSRTGNLNILASTLNYTKDGVRIEVRRESILSLYLLKEQMEYLCICSLQNSGVEI